MTVLIAGLDEQGTREITALARKLGATVKPQPLEPGSLLTKEERTRLVYELSGSWQSDKTTDELVREIYEARTDNSHRDVSF